MKSLPESVAFLKWLWEVAKSLDTLDDLPNAEIHTLKGATEVAIEVKARQRAHQVILEILGELVVPPDMPPPKPKNDDYAM